MLNVVDGCIPSDMATGNAAEIEEERRLLYVAMTRARHHLHLLVPQRFYVTQQSAYGDRHLYAAISRFLPESIRDRFVHLGSAEAALRKRSRLSRRSRRSTSPPGCALPGTEAMLRTERQRESGSIERADAAA